MDDEVQPEVFNLKDLKRSAVTETNILEGIVKIEEFEIKAISQEENNVTVTLQSVNPQTKEEIDESFSDAQRLPRVLK